MKKINRIGEKTYNNQGCLMEIIKYTNCNDIDIKFTNGCILKHQTLQNFRKKNIKNPYHPETYSVGYIGEGEYQSKINDKFTKQYITWSNMLKRCYNNEYQAKHKTYIDCTVCKEWHNFQNFAKWFDENYYEIGNERMELDKDILFKNNKIYSPKTCMFVPQRINILFIKNDKQRGQYPIGVHYHKKNNKYISRCNINKNNRKYLGSFDTKEEAFLKYKNFKENYIKQIADEYKDKIPNILYNAMYKWNVEIND